MVPGDEGGMGRRLGQTAGILTVAVVMIRLSRLLQSGPGIVQWELILIASVFLGGVIWWLLDQLSLGRPLILGLFAAAGLVLLIRISVPLTLVGGILPSFETPGALVDEMGNAFRVIRSGVPPVLPTEGIVAILAMVMWVIGALYAWGIGGGPVAAMTLPSIVVYLQFAVFDRVGAGIAWMTASGLVLVLAITSVALERRSDTGRARDSDGMAMPRRSMSNAMTMAGAIGLVAIVVATSGAGLVSEYGNIPWRTGGSGFGGEGGRIAFDRFVDLRQRLINRTNAVLFQAKLGRGAPPPETVYWRLETFDEFDGVAWGRSSGSIRNYEPGQDIGADHLRYQGTTVEVLQKVRIQALAEARVPTAGVATEIQGPSDERAIDPQEFQVTQDATIVYQPGLVEGDIYQVSASYPDQRADLGFLASNPSGELSPMFANAAANGEFGFTPESRETDIETPPDLDFYTRLPPELPPSLRGIAELRTFGATTDFEHAWMLEHWFRYSGDFTYSTEVSTGHDALLLDDWLSEPTSQNYRTGYCEQFATSMAVLARILGIPSRVVLGFTPGAVTQSGDIVVRDTNAHAWVEMWMDGTGWVTFDPTPLSDSAQPASISAAFDPDEFVDDPGFGDILSEPIDPATIQGPRGFQEDESFEESARTPRWWLLIFPAVVLIGLVVPTVKRFRRRRRLRKAREGDIAAVWDEIVDRLVDLGEPVPSSMTPMELARMTDDALLPLAVHYSAAIYGGRLGEGSEMDLLSIEGWLVRRYETGQRMRAAMSIKSLLD